MIKNIFSINKETIKKTMEEYIDTEFAKYLYFNSFYKELMIDKVIEVIGTKVLYDYIKVYEDEVSEITKNTTGVITGYLKSIDMFTGKPIYNYMIKTKTQKDLITFGLYWNRVDNKKDHYSYKIEHNINNFIDLLNKEGDINEIAELDVISLLKVLTESVYDFIQKKIDEEKEIVPEAIIKEILFILTDMEANKIIPTVLKEENIENSKK